MAGTGFHENLMEVSRPHSRMHGIIRPMPSLPDSRAFVVQLSDRTDLAARLPTGRIEHVESGLRMRFSSREELWAFIERVLAREGQCEEGSR